MLKTSLIVSLAALCLWGASGALAAGDPRWERTVSHSPAFVREGQYVTFHTMVEAGPEPVRNLELRGGVDGVEIIRKTIPQLNRDQKMAVSFRWKSRKGQHKAYFQINPGRGVVDSNPGNNRVELSLTVAGLAQSSPKIGGKGKPGKSLQAKLGQAPGEALPDLTVVKMIVFNPQNPSAGRRDFKRGDPIVVQATLKNIGQKPTGGFWVQLETKSQESAGSGVQTKMSYEKQSTPSLDPGKSRMIEFNLGHQHSPAKAIYYDFTVTADYNHGVTEFDEDNNAKTINAERRP